MSIGCADIQCGHPGGRAQSRSSKSTSLLFIRWLSYLCHLSLFVLDPGRIGSSKDHILLEHQPRVPNPVNPHARPPRGARFELLDRCFLFSSILSQDLLAKPDVPDKENLMEQLSLVHRNSLRLLKLVNTLLDFSKIEAGRTNACFRPTDLCQLTHDLASTFRSATERYSWLIPRTV